MPISNKAGGRLIVRDGPSGLLRRARTIQSRLQFLRGLDDAILIKDNHIAVAGGIRAVLERARAAAGHLVKIEIEVDTLDQLREVLAVGLADAVLLDNMDVATMRKAVEMVAGKFPLEASGGINLETIAEIAKTGVDYASSGWITHSAPNLDVALDIEM